MAIRMSLMLCTNGFLFANGVAFAQQPSSTTGPAAGRNVEPSTAIQKENDSGAQGAPTAAGSPGVEAKPGSQGGKAPEAKPGTKGGAPSNSGISAIATRRSGYQERLISAPLFPRQPKAQPTAASTRRSLGYRRRDQTYHSNRPIGCLTLHRQKCQMLNGCRVPRVDILVRSAHRFKIHRETAPRRGLPRRRACEG